MVHAEVVMSKDCHRDQHCFLVDKWTHVAVKDKWLHPLHVFGMQNPLKDEIRYWLDENVKGLYIFVDETQLVLAFSRDNDASWFMLRWS